jgi:molybdenum cofactor cytidylyltransferase
MKFGPVPIERAEGKILGHHVAGADGRRALRKGRPLTVTDIALLRQLGRQTVYVAELEPGDVDENAAAWRVAQAVSGQGIRLSGPSTGRVNLMATSLGILRVDVERLAQINACEGITLATLLDHTAVGTSASGKTSPLTGRKMVGTVKILPYGLPDQVVRAAEAVAAKGGPVLWSDPIPARAVAVILSGSPTAERRVRDGFIPPLRGRLEALDAQLCAVDFVPLEDEQGEGELSAMLLERIGGGAELLILAGETAVMDRYDIAPRAIERAGGDITCFGAPVDPGNLLLLGYVGAVPVLGAPGCVRSPKANIVDWVLPRLLVGDRLTRADIFSLGHGGLLEDVEERPMPRGRLP